MSLHNIALTISLGLCCLLSVHAWLQHRRLCARGVDNTRLNAVVARVAKMQVSLEGRAHRLSAELADLQQRQVLLDARPNGSHRLESAVRVARQGAANEALLRDLGLSDAEAALLLRLHGMSAGAPGPAPSPPVASQAASLAQRLEQRSREH